MIDAALVRTFWNGCKSGRACLEQSRELSLLVPLRFSPGAPQSPRSSSITARHSRRIVKSDLAFESRTRGAQLNTPGLITDDTIRRYSAPRLERLD